MANVRIKDLPSEAAPADTDQVPLDNLTTRQTTLALIKSYILGTMAQARVKGRAPGAGTGAPTDLVLDTDAALAADSDSIIPTQKAVKAYADTKVPTSYLDTDTSLAADSDLKVATQKATKAYADTKLAITAARELQTGAITFYVNGSTGSDSNTGRSSGQAVATIQKGIDLAYSIDTGGNNVVVSIADGAYTAGAVAAGHLIGGGMLYIAGNEITPANVTVTCASSDCFRFVGGRHFIYGMTLKTTGAYTLIRATMASYVQYSAMVFDDSGESYLSTESNSTTYAFGANTMIGDAVSAFHTTGHGTCVTTGTFTLTGTPAFSAYFAGNAGMGSSTFGFATFTGAATGKRFLAHNWGVIDVGSGSDTFLPGSIAGEVSDLGSYVGSSTYIGLVGAGALPVASGGTGQTTAAAAGLALGDAAQGARVLFKLIGADMNSTSDQAFTKVGTFTSFAVIANPQCVNASTSLTTAVGGIYPTTGKGGNPLVAASQTYTAQTAANKITSVAIANRETDVANYYLSLSTPQGAAATADFYIFGVPLS